MNKILLKIEMNEKNQVVAEMKTDSKVEAIICLEVIDRIRDRLTQKLLDECGDKCETCEENKEGKCKVKKTKDIVDKILSKSPEELNQFIKDMEGLEKGQ